MYSLTLQLYSQGNWRDAMRMDFEKPEAGLLSPCSFAYDQHYLVEHLNALDRVTVQSVSATLALGWDLQRTAQVPAFLHDILPAGAARRFLLARLAVPADEMLGLNTIRADGMSLEEARKPSLWMKRFDRGIDKHGVKRIAVESVYSLVGVTRPGSYMTHVDAMRALTNAWMAR
jgi:hypothetical protein